MEDLDYPLPPHHYQEFAIPDALQPPDIRRLAKLNPEFYALGGIETFVDRHEKITPNYLADAGQKQIMLR